MILFKEIPFTFEGENYEIKIFYEENLINVVAFQNNYPASGFRHQIKVPKNISVKNVLEQAVVNEYVDICRKDIMEKRWAQLLKIKKSEIVKT